MSAQKQLNDVVNFIFWIGAVFIGIIWGAVELLN